MGSAQGTCLGSGRESPWGFRAAGPGLRAVPRQWSQYRKRPSPWRDGGRLFPSTHPHPGLGQAGEREGGQAERQPLCRGRLGVMARKPTGLGGQSCGPRALVAPSLCWLCGSRAPQNLPPAPSTAAGSTEAPAVAGPMPSQRGHICSCSALQRSCCSEKAPPCHLQGPAVQAWLREGLGNQL